MKAKILNLFKPSNLMILRTNNTLFSLKNIVFFSLINALLLSVSIANCNTIIHDNSIEIPVESTFKIGIFSNFEGVKIYAALNHEDRQQMREEMRQQWDANSEVARQKLRETWKQMGTEEKERMRRDMAVTISSDSASANSTLTPPSRR